MKTSFILSATLWRRYSSRNHFTDEEPGAPRCWHLTQVYTTSKWQAWNLSLGKSGLPNPSFLTSILLLLFSPLTYREKGREGERMGEKHQCVVASHAPPTGDLASLQPRHVSCLSEDRTGDRLVCRRALNPLSHTSQGYTPVFKETKHCPGWCGSVD